MFKGVNCLPTGLIIFLPSAEMLIRERQIIGLKVTLPMQHHYVMKNADP